MTAEAAVRDRVALLTELECSSSFDAFAAVRAQAAELRALGSAAGDDVAVHRCDMLIADVLLREGRLGEGGRSARRTQAWAEQHGEPYVLARAHRVLSNFYRMLGDFPEALAHAVQGVSHLPADAPPAVRARHLIMLGCALDDNGSFDEGELRYHEVLRIAGELGDEGLTLRALNNMAFNAYEAGDEPTASALAVRMREVARRGRPLAAKELDTIARVAMMAGRHDELEATLAGALDGTMLDTDGDGAAECLLTLAEARRETGRLEAAQAALDRAVQCCERNGLTRAMQAVLEVGEFREMANRDALTGIYNRRYVDEQLPILLRRGRTLSVAILDLDHFKQVNDTLSHATGDEVLRRLGRLLPDGAHGPAVAARLGGEEFLLILPGFDAAAATRWCEALRREIRDFPWATITGTLRVTASIGVATATGLTTVPALLAAADRNLYAAKRAGRDRVVG